MVVILDEPETEKWGGVVAAPVFRYVAERVLRHMNVAPNEAKIIKTFSAQSEMNAPLITVH